MDNFQITEGSGTIIAAHENIDGSKEQKIQITLLPSIAGTVAISNFPSTQPVSGTLAINNFPSSQAVTGTFFQATQPISGSVSISNFPGSQTVTGPLTDTQLRATAVPVSGPLTDTQLRATPVPMSGTIAVSNFPANQQISGTVAVIAASLSVTATGAAAAAVTATLPAVAGQFHYITGIEIQAYTTLARTGSATPVVVTSTNLAGTNAWTFASAGAIGTTDSKWFSMEFPFRSAVAGTVTTIVCPATTSVIWRVNVLYYTA